MRRGRKAKPYPGTVDVLMAVLTYDPVSGAMSTIGPHKAEPRMNHNNLMVIKCPTNELTMRGNRQADYFRADHLAWMYVTGTWPEGWIEYVDGFPHNLAIENLVHVDDEGVRWWYGAQPDSDVMELVRVEGNATDTGPIAEVYDLGGETTVIKPRVADGWLNRTKLPTVETQLEEDLGLDAGEFGKDWG